MKPPIDTRLSTPAPRATIPFHCGSFQRGLSLIELMISITLGLIILGALSTLFINQTRTRVELDKSNRMINNGRYAMELLSNDLRVAGYLGEYVPTLSTCSYAPVGIWGYDAGIANKPSTVGLSGITNANVRDGSDILIVRRASTATPTAAGSAVDGVEYLQVSLCQFDALRYVISETPADFILRQKSCKSDDIMPYAAANLAPVRRMLEHVYFVSPDNEVGDGIPTLKRQETNQTTGVREIVPMVEGIEYMQIEYGVDNNNTFTITAETTAASLLLQELSHDPVANRIKPGMGVYSSPKIPAGYTVVSMTLPNPVTAGTITTEKASGAGSIAAGTGVALTIPYLTATITPNSTALTNLSADPTLALARPGYEICGGGIASGSTIEDVTETTITLTKPALPCDGNPLSTAACPNVPLTIPAIVISPRPLAGDGVADVYKAAPSDTEWPNVVSVKLTLLARNTEETTGHTDTKTYSLANGQTVGPFNDKYKRHVYTQYIRLVITSGQRE